MKKFFLKNCLEKKKKIQEKTDKKFDKKKINKMNRISKSTKDWTQANQFHGQNQPYFPISWPKTKQIIISTVSRALILRIQQHDKEETHRLI